MNIYIFDFTSRKLLERGVGWGRQISLREIDWMREILVFKVVLREC